jgi:peptide chain release factor 2
MKRSALHWNGNCNAAAAAAAAVVVGSPSFTSLQCSRCSFSSSPKYNYHHHHHHHPLSTNRCRCYDKTSIDQVLSDPVIITRSLLFSSMIQEGDASPSAVPVLESDDDDVDEDGDDDDDDNDIIKGISTLSATPPPPPPTATSSSTKSLSPPPLPSRTTTTRTTTPSSSSSSSPTIMKDHSVVPPLDWIELRQQFDDACQLYQQNVLATSHPPANLTYLNQQIADLEIQQSQPNFWKDENHDQAQQVHQLLSLFQQLRNKIQKWDTLIDDGQTIIEMLQECYQTTTTTPSTSSSSSSSSTSSSSELSSEEQAALVQELRAIINTLTTENQEYSIQLLLNGPYDDAPARVVITAGAGGTEANDWVADLKRMYERYAIRNGYDCVIEDVQPGDVTGYKSVDMIISGGSHPYGYLQGEKGTHRLVRLSPFNANNKRQTTFAGVDVSPDVLNDDHDLMNITIPDRDLEIQAIRSGGKGGQNVNKVSTAIRMKHLPTGIQVKVTQERSQILNRQIALRRLKAQLLVIAQEQRLSQIQQIRGDMVEASWGMQIRSYVLHPYKMIKDTRTGWETSNTQQFLDGDINECIRSYLRYKAAKAQEISQ